MALSGKLYQFHQMLIVERYLTRNPDVEAARALLLIVYNITNTDKDSFVGMLELWLNQYKEVLNERGHDKRMKRPPYMRPRLRSAYLSLKRNTPWLWTFHDRLDLLIPRTNNGLECIFSDIKAKVRMHSGLTREHRKKLIDEYISRHY